MTLPSAVGGRTRSPGPWRGIRYTRCACGAILAAVAAKQEAAVVAHHHRSAEHRAWRRRGGLWPMAERPAATLSLTCRQADVLRLAANGLPVAVIARRLGIAPASVKQHLEAARRRLGARNRVHAVALAYGRRLLGELQPGPPLRVSALGLSYALAAEAAAEAILREHGDAPA